MTFWLLSEQYDNLFPLIKKQLLRARQVEHFFKFIYGLRFIFIFSPRLKYNAKVEVCQYI